MRLVAFPLATKKPHFDLHLPLAENTAMRFKSLLLTENEPLRLGALPFAIKKPHFDLQRPLAENTAMRFKSLLLTENEPLQFEAFQKQKFVNFA